MATCIRVHGSWSCEGTRPGVNGRPRESDPAAFATTAAEGPKGRASLAAALK